MTAYFETLKLALDLEAFRCSCEGRLRSILLHINFWWLYVAGTETMPISNAKLWMYKVNAWAYVVLYPSTARYRRACSLLQLDWGSEKPILVGFTRAAERAQPGRKLVVYKSERKGESLEVITQVFPSHRGMIYGNCSWIYEPRLQGSNLPSSLPPSYIFPHPGSHASFHRLSGKIGLWTQSLFPRIDQLPVLICFTSSSA